VGEVTLVEAVVAVVAKKVTAVTVAAERWRRGEQVGWEVGLGGGERAGAQPALTLVLGRAQVSLRWAN
jgi:hypothetical protein